MKAVTVKELKIELNDRPHSELVDICLRISKFKKENKELLTYLIFESNDEAGYISSVKYEIDEQFELINTKTYYFIKKSVRKMLRRIKNYIRYSKNIQTEIVLLIYFCEKLKSFSPSITGNQVLVNIYNRELSTIKKKVLTLHEDLQFDYQDSIDSLYL